MGTPFLSEIKKQAASFLHEKYRTARLALTDVTEAEMLTEEAIDNNPWGPDARTMTRIAEASFEFDDYWRIVDVLHRRFYSIDWKQWRQSYKALVLLDFLITHGPEDFFQEFQHDIDVIKELGTFKHIDEKGFNWGVNMQKKSERILKLLEGGDTLKEERLKALKVTKEIQGFGNMIVSPSASPSSATSRTSLGSFSTSCSTWNETDDLDKHETLNINKNAEALHAWDCPPIQERGSLLYSEEEQEERGDHIGRIRSKLSSYDDGKVNFRSFSDVGKVVKKKIDRQLSMGY